MNFSLGESLLQYQLNTFNTDVIISAHKLEKKLWINLQTSKRRVIRIDSFFGICYYLYYSFLWYMNLKHKQYRWEFLDKFIFLFTSWSTGNPKLVQCSVADIKKNIDGWLEYTKPKENNAMLCVLPYFHSFGVNTGLIFPLLQQLGYLWTTIKFYFDYRLTDPLSLGSSIQKYNIQHLVITPYFLSFLLDQCPKEKLQSLQSVYVWGDFSKQSLIQKFYKILPKAKYQKWYGLTECFPIISILPSSDVSHNSQSDGKILSHIKYKILDKDGNYIDNGKGILLIDSDCTIGSYVNKPFELITIQGKEYFNTHDYVYVNEDRHLTVLWREKRIIKKGIEMINLDYLQGLLNQQFEGICVGKETHIYFFSTQEINIMMINTYIMNLGLSHLYNIHKVVKIKSIPTMGIGKVNYKALDDYLTVSV